jgi:hypothetical protein
LRKVESVVVGEYERIRVIGGSGKNDGRRMSNSREGGEEEHLD